MEPETLEFVGTTTHTVVVDPEEFRGVSAAEIEEALREMLSEDRAGVHFFESDLIAAAQRIHEKLNVAEAR